MIGNLVDKVKSTTPKDILMSTVLAGGIAGITGVGTLLDKYVFDYTLGFKSKKSSHN